ncbi:MAG: response regulator transcription factor [Nitriliruptoraceae bacterium]|nr:response regulator transcription factor [Nitriliruptoraceae bacterium]
MSLETALAATEPPLPRVPLLIALVDVAEVTQDPDLAGSAAAELAVIAATFTTPGIRARAATAAGVAHLLAGEPDQALAALREASRTWRTVGGRYDTARTQVRLAQALAAAGDTDTADRERDQAIATFVALGARPDLEAVAAEGDVTAPAAPGGLTDREVEVLRLVADGASNATVAEHLTISARTVERHVSNIFLKLGVSSRTQAARFAFEHGLVGGTT